MSRHFYKNWLSFFGNPNFKKILNCIIVLDWCPIERDLSIICMLTCTKCCAKTENVFWTSTYGGYKGRNRVLGRAAESGDSVDSEFGGTQWIHLVYQESQDKVGVRGTQQSPLSLPFRYTQIVSQLNPNLSTLGKLYGNCNTQKHIYYRYTQCT